MGLQLELCRVTYHPISGTAYAGTAPIARHALDFDLQVDILCLMPTSRRPPTAVSPQVQYRTRNEGGSGYGYEVNRKTVVAGQGLPSPPSQELPLLRATPERSRVVL